MRSKDGEGFPSVPFALCPTIYSGNERFPASAEELWQQQARHHPDTGKVVQDDAQRDKTRPQAVERRLGQQKQGFPCQNAEVDGHPRRMDAHADHVVGVDGAQGEHDAKAEEGRVGRAHRPPPLDEEIVHDAVAHRTGQHRPQAVGGLFVDDVGTVQKLVEAAAGGGQRKEGHEMPRIVIVRLHDVHDRAAEPDDARRAAEQHAGIGTEDLGKERRPALFFGHGRELPRIVEDQTQRGQDGRQEVAGGEQAAPRVAAVPFDAVAHLPHKEQVGCVDDPEADLRRDHRQRELEHLLPEALV